MNPVISADSTGQLAALQRIENDQPDTEQLSDGSASELRDIVRILVSSFEKVHADSAGAAGELHQIEEIIRSARTAAELQATKPNLIHALSRLREQSLDQEQSASGLLTFIQGRVVILEQSAGADTPEFSDAAVNLSASPPAPSRENVKMAGGSPAGKLTSVKPRFDAATGLPGQDEAETAILALRPADRSNSYAVAFHVKRMGAVKARFGEKFSNDLLLFCAQQIVGLVSASEETLFRWRNPGGFVALLKYEGFLRDFRLEIGKAFEAKMAFSSADGSVLLPVSVSTYVMHAALHDCAELLEGLEKFFSSAAIQG